MRESTSKVNHESTDRMNIGEINIEEIMNEIRQEIREKGFTEDIPVFGGARDGEHLDCRYSEAEYLDLLYEVSEDSLVMWHRDLGGSAPVVFLKKAVRKLMSFVGLPIVNDQNCFNAAVTKEFGQLAGYIRMQSDELDKCRRGMEQMRDQLTEQVDQLTEQVGRLTEQNDRLKAQIGQLHGDLDSEGSL